MKINSGFKMGNMQTRVEMAGDKPGRGAVTLRLEGTMNRDEVKMLFSTESSYKKVLGHIWDKDGELTTSDIKDIPLTVEIHGGTAIVENGFNEKFDFDGVKADSVLVTPMPGHQCEVVIKMSVYPDKDSLWFLFTHQKLSIEVTCTPGQMSVDEGIERSRDAETADVEQPQDGDLPFDDTAAEDADHPFAGMNVE